MQHSCQPVTRAVGHSARSVTTGDCRASLYSESRRSAPPWRLSIYSRPAILEGPNLAKYPLVPEREILQGGVANAGAVAREGAYVLRPSNPHTEVIHALLRHVRAEGFEGVPEPVTPGFMWSQ